MTQWRNQSFWSKAWAYAFLAFLLLISDGSVPNWLDGSSSSRKRVFSPGFVVLCIFVAVFELVALNHFYGAR